MVRFRFLLVLSLLLGAAVPMSQPRIALAAPAKPATDWSFYVRYPFNGVSVYDVGSNAYGLGCSQGTYDSTHGNIDSEVILDFGAQTKADTGTFLPKTNTLVGYANDQSYTEAFAYGYYICTGADTTKSPEAGDGDKQ